MLLVCNVVQVHDVQLNGINAEDQVLEFCTVLVLATEKLCYLSHFGTSSVRNDLQNGVCWTQLQWLQSLHIILCNIKYAIPSAGHHCLERNRSRQSIRLRQYQYAVTLFWVFGGNECEIRPARRVYVLGVDEHLQALRWIYKLKRAIGWSSTIKVSHHSPSRSCRLCI